jgi:hypothetical protein
MAIAMSGYHYTMNKEQGAVTCNAMEHNHLDECHGVQIP